MNSDLAELYGVEVKQLKRQVRRNIDRFPADFMIQLSKEEYESLRRHFGTLKRGEEFEQLNVVAGLNSKDEPAKISPFGRNDKRKDRNETFLSSLILSFSFPSAL
jgi:hypothetical protein